MFVVVTAAAALGCGSAESNADEPSDCTGGCWEPTAADEAFFTKMCTRVEACCVANAYRDDGAADVEGCKDAFRRAGLSRDAALRERCLAEMESLAGAGLNCLPEAWDLSGACARLTYEPSGPQAPGEPCVNRADCQGAPGQVTLCAGVSSEFSPTFGLCMRVKRGEAGNSTPCLGTVTPDGLIIAGPSYVAGQHQPLTTGVVCEEHAGIQCGPGDNPASWTCQQLSADGAACTYSTTCASKKCLTSEGVEAGFDRPGTCTERVPAGRICEDYVSHAVCDAATFCHDNGDPNQPGGICEPKLAVGGTCNGDGMCVSGNCDDTTHTCSATTSSGELSLLGYCSRF